MKPCIETFDYAGVTLDDGPLKRQCDEVRDYYVRIPNDDLLKGFRARAGLPAPGADLGGWYSQGTYLVFGQIISGLARLYAGTGDLDCRDKANTLVTEWAKCIAPDGYFYAAPQPHAPHYVYDKVVGGLVDAALYCGNKEAMGCLSRITDWAERNLGRKRPYGADGAEWYTLSENLYRAYLLTGEDRYRDFARVWEYTEYWDLYAKQADIFSPRPSGKSNGVYHAYSHVNTLGGAGAAFVATGQSHYLETLIHAYDFLQDRQCFATGGYGPDEQLLPQEKLATKLLDTHNTFETQCGTWAAFKMCKYLIRFTGDARYGDWVERLMINGVGASIPMSSKGHVFYYSDYNITGARKSNHPEGWTCCTGTRPMAVADFHDLIYFRDADGVYVNLYASSTLRWRQDRQKVLLRQTTRFPEEDTAGFTLSLSKPKEFALRFRVPGWLGDAPISLIVNGVAVGATADRHHWVGLRRKWHDNDCLTIKIPMPFHISRLLPQRAYPAAALRGPVVLAFRSERPALARTLDLAHLERALLPSPGEPLTYHLTADPAVLVRPFYSYKEDETYLLYLDPEAPQRIPHQKVQFHGDWSDSGLFRFANVPGQSAECSFVGTGIRWLGRAFDDAGRAEVKIDGKPMGVVDMFGPGRGLPFDWRVNSLGKGRHTLTITVSSEKNPESTNHYINVIGFDVFDVE